MLIEHLGEVVVASDPSQIALENSLVRALRMHGPLRQRDLWFRSSAPCYGRARFEHTVTSLVERGVVVSQGTHRKNSFILRLAPDARRRARNQVRAQKALTPEVA